MTVFKNASHEAKNLISFRGNMTTCEMQVKVKELTEYIKASGAEKAGALISATYSVDRETRASDTEIYIPVSKEIPSAGEFIFLPALTVSDCVMVRHRGDPRHMRDAYAELAEKVSSMGLKMKPPIYNVYIDDTGGPEAAGEFEVDIYVMPEISKSI